MAGTRDGDRDAESRRILDRVAREEHSGLGFLGRGTERARGHLAADDADQNDWIEVWGTRIGRAHRHASSSPHSSSGSSIYLASGA